VISAKNSKSRQKQPITVKKPPNIKSLPLFKRRTRVISAQIQIPTIPTKGKAKDKNHLPPEDTARSI